MGVQLFMQMFRPDISDTNVPVAYLSVFQARKEFLASAQLFWASRATKGSNLSYHSLYFGR